MMKINILLLLILFTNCKQSLKGYKDQQVNVKYSKYFDYTIEKDLITIEVFNPWQNAQKKKFVYNLTTNKNKIKTNYIKIPVKRVVCLSTTHLGFIEALDERASLVGISGINYVYDSTINAMIKQNLISEVGYENNLNIEKIIQLRPDVVFVYDITGSLSSKFKILEKSGIPIVYVAEYLETTPLGRSEWIKFFGLFFNKNFIATEIFDKIEKNYLQIKNSNYTKKKKLILTNIPFNGIWYVPGGNSYMKHLIEDAGGRFYWTNNNATESIVVQFEEIIKLRDSFDILIHTSYFQSIEEILKIDSRLSHLKCIENKQVFNNIKRINSKNANDFWESGVVRVDRILKDLYLCFTYADKYSDSLFYYKKLN